MLFGPHTMMTGTPSSSTSTKHNTTLQGPPGAQHAATRSGGAALTAADPHQLLQGAQRAVGQQQAALGAAGHDAHRRQHRRLGRHVGLVLALRTAAVGAARGRSAAHLRLEEAAERRQAEQEARHGRVQVLQQHHGALGGEPRHHLHPRLCGKRGRGGGGEREMAAAPREMAAPRPPGAPTHGGGRGGRAERCGRPCGAAGGRRERRGRRAAPPGTARSAWAATAAAAAVGAAPRRSPTPARRRTDT